MYIFITSFLALIGPYVFIKKYSKDYLISTLIFVALEFFSFYIFSVRQCIAISVILLSTKYIVEKKFFKFALMIIIATLVHKTSAMFIIAYFLRNIKVSSKNCLLFMCITILAFIFKQYIMNTIMNVVFDQYTDKSIANTGYSMFLLMIGILITMIYIIIKSRININENEYMIERISFNLYLIAIILQIFAMERDIVARLVTDYYIYIVILLPNILTFVKNKKNRYTIKICTCCALIGLGIFFITRYSSNMAYSFFWN